MFAPRDILAKGCVAQASAFRCDQSSGGQQFSKGHSLSISWQQNPRRADGKLHLGPVNRYLR
jgi:hypothetical protein